MLAPAQAWFHRDVLFLIGLEQLSIRTPCGAHRGGQDGPALRVRRGDQRRGVHAAAIAALNLGYFGLRWTASTPPFLRDTARFDSRVEDRVTPRPGLAPPPPLATPFVLGHGRLCVGGTSTPPRFSRLDVLGNTRGVLGLGGGIRRCRLVGQRAGVDDQQASCRPVEAPVRVLHGHTADDTVPRPAARRLLTGPPRFFEPSG
jgi:hypothetical protein